MSDLDYWRERAFVPCFDELFSLAVALIPFPRDAEFGLLEIGAGSGLFSALVAQAFPRVRLTLVERDEELLQAAQQRLSPFADRCDFLALDWTEEDVPGRYDTAVTALALQEMALEDRAEFYESTFESLARNGMLLNLERVRGLTPAIDYAYRAVWQQQVEGDGADGEDVAAHLAALEDRLPTITEHLEAIAGAGFAEVNCWYKNLSFTLCSGVRAT